MILEVTVFIVILALLSIFTGVIAIFSFRKKELIGKLIGVVSILTNFACVSYLCTVFHHNKLTVNICYNIYFASVSLIVAVYLPLNILYTKTKFNGVRKWLCIVLGAYGFCDFVFFISNIFTRAMVDFVPSNYSRMPYFTLEMHLPYYIHLAYSYLVIILILIQLIRKIVLTPLSYKKPYIITLITLIFVILVDAFYLFIPVDSVFSRLDISLVGYYILIITVFITYYYKTKKGMAPVFMSFIVNNASSGYVLFNYEGNLVFTNDNVKTMVKNIFFDNSLTIQKFTKTLGIESPLDEDLPESITSQISIKIKNSEKSYRLNFRKIKNKKGLVESYLYSFTNIDLEIDPLTGFQSFYAFKNFATRKRNFIGTDTVFVLFDIDGLGLINSTRGHAYGDKIIKELADLMKEKFPNNSYFIRGNEASLGVFVIGSNQEKVNRIADSVATNYGYSNTFTLAPIDKNSELFEGFLSVQDTLNTVKLMDINSRRSSTINALMKALQEVDVDTCEHVKRTKEMADKLAVKMKLSEFERTKLGLLAMLHDIGKLAIPLEILKKPTKLTDEEFAVMQSHALKGYNIALASPSFSLIANDILHHHERWDGNGYPDGLTKESIPLLSRIVAVVDSFDAMTTFRSYKKQMTISEAIEELKKCSATQFDPRITKEFIEILESENHEQIIVENKNKQDFVISKPIETGKYNVFTKDISFCKYIIDDGIKITSIDDKFTQFTGYTKEDVNKGLLQIDLIPEEDKEYYAYKVSENVSKYGFVFLEHRLVKKDKTIINVFCYGTKYFDSATNGYRDEIIVFNIANSNLVNQIIEKEKEKAKIQLASWESIYRTDSLTGLLSHNAFENDVNAKLLKKENDYAFVILDIDSFKQFNDTYGHNKGDLYLIDISNLIIENLFSVDDLASRLGGDEFAIFMKIDKDRIEETKIQMQNTFNIVNKHLKAKYGDNTGISMGVSFTIGNCSTFEQLYEAADTSLYNVKKNGKEAIDFYSSKKK